MEFGLCLEPLVEREGLASALEVAVGAGYDGCEFALWDLVDDGSAPTGSDSSTPTEGDAAVPTSADRERARDRLDRHGLDAIGVYRPFRPSSAHRITSRDPGRRRRAAEHLAEVAAVCGDLGGEVIVLGAPEQRSIPEGSDRETALANAAETLRSGALLAALERHGVTLCVEPLTWGAGLLSTAEEGAAFVERVDNPRIRLVLDGFHLRRESGSTAGATDRLDAHGSRLAHVHADGASGRGPGRGDPDYREVLPALDELGHDGYVSVEFHEFYRDPPADADWRRMAAESVEYLRDVE